MNSLPSTSAQGNAADEEFEWEDPSTLPISAHHPPSISPCVSSTGTGTTKRPPPNPTLLPLHLTHLTCLISHLLHRNTQTLSILLHARLLSLIPARFSLLLIPLTPAIQPDKNERARQFRLGVSGLMQWWGVYFKILPKQDTIRGIKSLAKHALQASGSANTSAVLFVALLRAAGVPARLTAAFIPVSWRSAAAAHSSQTPPPPPPGVIFQAEVFSRPEGIWYPICPARQLWGKEASARIAGAAGPVDYVVSAESDGTLVDVSARYNASEKQFTRLVKSRGKLSAAWWQRLMAKFARDPPLNRDAHEKVILFDMTQRGGMPTTLSGFKTSQKYVLERFVGKEEIVDPPTKIATFRGEPVYSRVNLKKLKSAQNWLRSGMEVRRNQLDHPMKEVKARIVTLEKRRRREMIKQMGEQEELEALYSADQVQLIRPPPIVNGEIPKNSFGNIDLYVPTMLPPGAVHLPQKGLGKIARKLGVSYAEAVTGFEFRSQRATPVLTGIVVALGKEGPILKAWEIWAAEQAERERIKLENRVINRWKRLIKGLEIKNRLEYKAQKRKEMESINDTEEVSEFALAPTDFVAVPEAPAPETRRRLIARHAASENPAASSPLPIQSTPKDDDIDIEFDFDAIVPEATSHNTQEEHAQLREEPNLKRNIKTLTEDSESNLAPEGKQKRTRIRVPRRYIPDD